MKKRHLICLLLLTLSFLPIFIFNTNAQDAKSLFIDAVKKQQNLLPKTFSCNISSTIFNDFLTQLPPDAFSKALKDIVIILNVDNGKISIIIDGIKPEYNDFALSYFNIYTELLSYVFISEEDLKKQFENFTISYEKNVFILKDNSELVSYNFLFSNNLITSIIFYQGSSKIMEVNIQYFSLKNFQLVRTITIINYDDKGNKKENIIINFTKYKV